MSFLFLDLPLQQIHLILLELPLPVHLLNLLVPFTFPETSPPLALLHLPELYLEHVLLMFHAQLLPLEELEGVLRVCQLPLRLVELVLQELMVARVRGGVIGGAEKGHTRGTGEEEFCGVVGELLGRLVLVGLGEVACEDVGGVGVIHRWIVG